MHPMPDLVIYTDKAHKVKAKVWLPVLNLDATQLWNVLLLVYSPSLAMSCQAQICSVHTTCVFQDFCSC